MFVSRNDGIHRVPEVTFRVNYLILCNPMVTVCTILFTIQKLHYDHGLYVWVSYLSQNKG
jgi:hypothetical protein